MRHWQKSANHFLIFCVFFHSSFAFINLLWQFFVARALQSFFLLLSNICPFSWNLICMFKNVRCYVYGSYIYIRLAKEHHIRNSNKKNVAWSQLSFSKCSKKNYCNGVVILNLELVYFWLFLAAYRTPLMRSIPTKQNNIYDIKLFEGLTCFSRIL